MTSRGAGGAAAPRTAKASSAAKRNAPAHPLRSDSRMLPPDAQFDEAPVAEAEEKVEQPRLYKVLLHNDDYTTMEFVVEILEAIFNMPEDQAIQVMLNVHVRGVGVAGIYTFEVAEMKVAKTIAAARDQEFPLLCTMEEA
jgi:ATP-dependent Clp protease adaptor protein ClpS